LRALAARTVRPVSSSARRAHIKRDQRKPHTRAAFISLGAPRPLPGPALPNSPKARACSRHASCSHPVSVWCTAQTRRRTHPPRPSRRSLPRPSPRRQMQSCRRPRPAGQRLPARAAVIGGDVTAVVAFKRPLVCFFVCQLLSDSRTVYSPYPLARARASWSRGRGRALTFAKN
jgi:hypothetical protein